MTEIIPDVGIGFSIEKLADGGSFAACFLDPQGKEWWLFIGVVLDEANRRIGYLSPKVIDRTLGTEIGMQWEDSGSLLQRVVSSIEGMDNSTIRSLSEMKLVIEAKGVV
jgi:hypothetical protein